MTQTNNSQPWALTLANVLAGPAPLDMVADAQDIPNVRLEAKGGLWYGHLGDHANQSTVTPLQMTYVSNGATVKVSGVPYSWSGSAWGAVGGGGTTLSYPGGTKTNPFASALTLANAAWQSFAQGSADFQIGFLGESTTQGQGSDPILAGEYPNRKSWVAYLAEMFHQAYGIDTGSMSVPPAGNALGPNYEWNPGTGSNTPVNGWLNPGNQGVAGSASFVNATTVDPGTWSAPWGNDYDTYEVFFLRSTAGIGTFTITATGGTPVVATTLNGTRGIASVTCVAATADRNNVLTFAADAPGNTIWIHAIKASNSKRKRTVFFLNQGVGATTTAAWASAYGTNVNGHSVNDLLSPKLTFVMLGGNDATNSVSVATFRANLQTIVTAVSAYSSVILLPPMPIVNSAPNLAIRQSYVDSLRASPLSGCMFLDVWDAWLAFTGPGNVYGGSGPHWTDLGYKMAAKAIFDALNALP